MLVEILLIRKCYVVLVKDLQGLNTLNIKLLELIESVLTLTIKI